MDDLPLADLVAFTAVARERSFRVAARKRAVSASSLSEAIRRLEERLGVRLLNRTTRSVTPTEAGERLMERLTPAMSEIAVALDDINSFRDRVGGTLRLNVPTVAAMVVMPDIVNRFLKNYPGISVEIVAEDSFIDVLAAGFDAGIRYDERLEKDMIAVPIGPRQQSYVTAAAPAYLAANGTPRHPRDILEHRCIGHRFLSRSNAPWDFEKDGESDRHFAFNGDCHEFDRYRTQCRGCRSRHHQDVLGIPRAAACDRRAGTHSRRVGNGLFRSVSLLCEPPTYAGSAPGLRRLP